MECEVCIDPHQPIADVTLLGQANLFETRPSIGLQRNADETLLGGQANR